jgi:hypothetical protein
MAEYGANDFRIHGITQARDEQEDEEEDNVKDEEDDGYNAEPVAVVRELVQQYGHNARAHRD